MFPISISLCSRNVHRTHVVMMLSRVRMMMTVMIPVMTMVRTPLKLRLSDILDTSAPIINPRKVLNDVKDRDVHHYRPEEVAEEEDGAGDEGEEGGGEGEDAGEDYRVTEVTEVIHDVTSLEMSACPIMTLLPQKSMRH